MLTACLNGDRSRADHPAMPVTPAELAEEAFRAAKAGATAVHLHPRGADKKESLDWADMARLARLCGSAARGRSAR
jgi:uncharacterized protein (DUF849 family)